MKHILLLAMTLKLGLAYGTAFVPTEEELPIVVHSLEVADSFVPTEEELPIVVHSLEVAERLSVPSKTTSELIRDFGIVLSDEQIKLLISSFNKYLDRCVPSSLTLLNKKAFDKGELERLIVTAKRMIVALRKLRKLSLYSPKEGDQYLKNAQFEDVIDSIDSAECLDLKPKNVGVSSGNMARPELKVAITTPDMMEWRRYSNGTPIEIKRIDLEPTPHGGTEDSSVVFEEQDSSDN